ncbi:MAG TPA: rRNA maturation RNase YbeY [Candidatus Paceibacterota bacterium]|nr:rRNA maturation RNase YbeY [Candidatus Paceibacterota bacterium]
MKNVSDTFEITNKTRSKFPDLPFLDMKDRALGKKYDLSLVFVGSARSRKMNQLYRGKDKPANVLSFPFSGSEGEIFIDLREARAQAPKYGKNFHDFVALLFVHGMQHLKGLDHGSKMEEAEKKILKYFSLA